MAIKKKVEVIGANGYPKNNYQRKATISVWFYDQMSVELSVREAVKFAKELTAAIEKAAGVKKDGE